LIFSLSACSGELDAPISSAAGSAAHCCFAVDPDPACSSCSGCTSADLCTATIGNRCLSAASQVHLVPRLRRRGALARLRSQRRRLHQGTFCLLSSPLYMCYA
jgi:hypothetical protein